MYHTIQFNDDLTVDLEVSPKLPLERLRIRRGTRLSAQVKPSVAETANGPVEVADLFFADGTATRSVPFEHFAFVD
jgi:hypothetical protein